MPLEGEYGPSPTDWVREQVELYETSGGSQGTTSRDSGLPVIIVTTRGHKTGKIRKIPVMRVEHDGEYAIVGSKGGAPEHPLWYYNLKADPEEITIQDGPEVFDASVHEAVGGERAEWWERSVATYPPYSWCQNQTERQIPVFVATRKGR